jgi:ankyrin repeat protein
MDYLIRDFYYRNLNVSTADNWTALHYSCFMNKFDATSLLIDSGADIYSRNKQFLTPLEMCVLNDNIELFFSLYNFHYDVNKLNSFDHPEVKISQ